MHVSLFGDKELFFCFLHTVHKGETTCIAGESVRGNTESWMFLANLYLSAFEIPNKQKGTFWLKKAVSQGYKPNSTDDTKF